MAKVECTLEDERNESLSDKSINKIILRTFFCTIFILIAYYLRVFIKGNDLNPPSMFTILFSVLFCLNYLMSKYTPEFYMNIVLGFGWGLSTAIIQAFVARKD